MAPRAKKKPEENKMTTVWHPNGNPKEIPWFESAEYYSCGWLKADPKADPPAPEKPVSEDGR